MVNEHNRIQSAIDDLIRERVAAVTVILADYDRVMSLDLPDTSEYCQFVIGEIKQALGYSPLPADDTAVPLGPNTGVGGYSFNESGASLNIEAVPIGAEQVHIHKVVHWPNPVIPPMIPTRRRTFRITDHLILLCALISLGAVLAWIVLAR